MPHNFDEFAEQFDTDRDALIGKLVEDYRGIAFGITRDWVTQTRVDTGRLSGSLDASIGKEPSLSSGQNDKTPIRTHPQALVAVRSQLTAVGKTFPNIYLYTNVTYSIYIEFGRGGGNFPGDFILTRSVERHRAMIRNG